MLLAIGVVHQTMQLTKSARHRDESNRALDSIALQFRRDIHLAKGVAVEATDTLVIKNTDGSRITYSSNEHEIIRGRMSETDKARDIYRLGEGSQVTFGIREEDNLALLVISNKNVGHENEPRIDLQIECTIGSWPSLGNSNGEQE